MKTPFLIMQRSAMSEQQKISILSNELVRRLSNVNHGWVEMSEVLEIIEKFIQQLKNSGYGIKQSREITVCGIKGWKSKIKNREKDGKGFYREGKSTLKARVRKKLTERENWFKDGNREKDEEMEVEKDQEKQKDPPGDKLSRSRKIGKLMREEREKRKDLPAQEKGKKNKETLG